MENIKFKLVLDLEDVPDKEKYSLQDELAIELNKQADYRASASRGDFLNVVAIIAQNLVDNKELLAALFGAATSALSLLTKIWEKKHKDKLLFLIKIDDGEIEISQEDLDKPEKLAEKFQKEHPKTAATITKKSSVVAKGQHAKH